eukprot:GILJ01036628.1.p1 GENE.GILJ01036628.1~~GILJ01036628.1.p1  ORF type:complete len:138 (-),score=30.62 GILJ01036628.1:365-778(-)
MQMTKNFEGVRAELSLTADLLMVETEQKHAATEALVAERLRAQHEAIRIREELKERAAELDIQWRQLSEEKESGKGGHQREIDAMARKHINEMAAAAEEFKRGESNKQARIQALEKGYVTQFYHKLVCGRQKKQIYT